MTERALNSDGAQTLSILIKKTSHAHDCIGFEQQQGVGWIVEVDLARFNGRYDRFGYRGHVDFQPELQRLFRTNASTRAAEFLSLDGLMKLELVAPVGFVAEGLEAEYLPPLLKHPLRVPVNLTVEPANSLGAARACAPVRLRPPPPGDVKQTEGGDDDER